MCHHGLHFPHRWGNNTLGIKETGTDYITAMHAAKEAIWLQQLIGKMFQPLTHPMTLYGNNFIVPLTGATF